MKTAEQCRAEYLNGAQDRDANGDRLWFIADRLRYPSDAEHPFVLWECQTAEGPRILAMRNLITGESRIQVEDGSPERSDDCAARFVLGMEWSDFCWGWQNLGDYLSSH